MTESQNLSTLSPTNWRAKPPANRRPAELPDSRSIPGEDERIKVNADERVEIEEDERMETEEDGRMETEEDGSADFKMETREWAKDFSVWSLANRASALPYAPATWPSTMAHCDHLACRVTFYHIPVSVISCVLVASVVWVVLVVSVVASCRVSGVGRGIVSCQWCWSCRRVVGSSCRRIIVSSSSSTWSAGPQSSTIVSPSFHVASPAFSSVAHRAHSLVPVVVHSRPLASPSGHHIPLNGVNPAGTRFRSSSSTSRSWAIPHPAHSRCLCRCHVPREDWRGWSRPASACGIHAT